MNRSKLRVALIALIVIGGFALSFAGRSALARQKVETANALGPLELGVLGPGEVPDEANAARWFVAGANAVVLTSEQQKELRRLFAGWPEWVAGDYELVEWAVAANAPAFELLARAVSAPAASFGIDYSKGSEADIPDLVPLLDATRLLTGRARLAGRNGDSALFVESVRILSRLAVALQAESTILTALIADVVGKHVLRLAAQGVQLDDSESLEALRAAVSSLDPVAALRRGIHGEATIFAHMAPWPRLTGELESPRTRLRSLVYWPIEPWIASAVLDHYRQLASCLDRPLAVARRECPAVRGEATWLARRNAFLATLFDAVLRVKASESSHHLLSAALELRIGGLASGVYDPVAVAVPQQDAVTGEPDRLETGPDGTVELSAPGALELFQQLVPKERADRHPPFQVTLPALPSPALEAP